MADPAEKWAEQARYDLETAKAMLACGRYLYVLLCCQQAVEKALKALIVRRTGQFPPRVHNLARLAQAAGVEPPDTDRADFLAELSAYYVQTRYPEEIQSLRERDIAETAADTLRKTEEVAKWLFSMLR